MLLHDVQKGVFEMSSLRIETTKLGATDIDVSQVCLGTWAIGGWLWGVSDDSQCIATIRAALDQGITFIDTAAVYGFGHSESLVGQAWKGHVARDKVVLATKAGLQWSDDGKVTRNCTRERLLQEIDDSLQRLQTDYIDLYQIHWPDPLVPIEETAEVMAGLLASGKIRAIGVSNYNPEQMDRFRSVAPLHSVQPPYNLFERQIDADVRPYAQQHGLAILAYGAICRGLLSGKMAAEPTFEGDDIRQYDPKFKAPRYAAYLDAVAKLDAFAQERYQRGVLELAVRWVIDQGAIALWGARHPQQLDRVEQVFGWSLSEADRDEIAAIVNDTITDPVGPEFMAPPARK